MKAHKIITIVVLYILTFSLLHAEAQGISVIDVKSNIALSDSDPVYKDFYLNAGDSSTLRKNMVITVKRKLNVKDSSTKSIGDIEAVVGQLKVIHIGAKVSVAREHKLTPRDEEPVLEQIGIMAGDRIDLAGSFIDNTKPKPKKMETNPAQSAGDKKTDSEMPAKLPEKTAESVNLIPQI